jgi:hypothetical protein
MFKEISLLVILQKERGVIKKRGYMLKKHNKKDVLQSKSIEKRERERERERKKA